MNKFCIVTGVTGAECQGHFVKGHPDNIIHYCDRPDKVYKDLTKSGTSANAKMYQIVHCWEKRPHRPHFGPGNYGCEGVWPDDVPTIETLRAEKQL